MPEETFPSSCLAMLVAMTSLPDHASAQTWFNVMPESTTVSVSIPAGTTYQIGELRAASGGAAARARRLSPRLQLRLRHSAREPPECFRFRSTCVGTVKMLQIAEDPRQRRSRSRTQDRLRSPPPDHHPAPEQPRRSSSRPRDHARFRRSSPRLQPYRALPDAL